MTVHLRVSALRDGAVTIRAAIGERPLGAELLLPPQAVAALTARVHQASDADAIADRMPGDALADRGDGAR